MPFKIKDINLADKGELDISWASSRMPVLNLIKREFEETKPLKSLTIGACLHVTKETAVLALTLKAGGADVYLAGSNPLSTQDHVAAALVKKGINVFAWRKQTTEEYYWCIEQVIASNPVITLDDGADLTAEIHKKRIKVKGGTEETTTGVIRLRALERSGELRYPIISVNDAYTKFLFDNRYGTGQSTIDGIMRATSTLIAGKKFVVCGYGWVGRGIALRAKGMGAEVIVTEVDPIKALEAAMDGYRVMSLKEASRIGDIFVTATGDINVIRREHFESMKDGAILANAGHFNVEISIKDLEELSVAKREIRENVTEYTLKGGNRVYLLAEGRLVNLACAEGHPSEVMDLSFSLQALSVKYLAEHADKLEIKVHRVPYEIDRRVAELKLKSLGIEIDSLTKEQEEYLKSWTIGT
ncbi:MAG: adenosylhomocysteinase [Thermoproteota archaeon]|jgi:adenosylhomocysteinase|nr:adenosylhomocysteinase [Thermoproteota archaeon]